MFVQQGLQDKVMSVSKWHPSAKNRLIYANGELHRLPSSISSVFKKMQPFQKPLYYAGLRDIFAKRGPMGDESIHSFVKRRFGPDVAEYLIDPLVRGICAGDCREISVNFLLKELKETEMKKKKSKPELARKAEHEGWSVWSLQGGLETLIDSMVDHLCNNGTEIKYDTKITSIELQGKKARIKMESGEEIETEQLISAIPAISLAPLLKKSHPEVSKILEDIKCVTVVASDNDPPLETFMGTSGRCINGGYRYQSTTPIELEEICKFSLSKTLGINEEPHRNSVQILKDSIPQSVGHNGRVNTIDEIISKESLPIIVTGASYKGVSVNDCVLNGIRSAENLLAR
ncbi:hypothetical protein QYM36_012473 [Artemia franciscana]|uniref:Protoporphyrinogen oxidase n=1 Tax=Artemia franciscana TaxID=6661 RepID=A0AA88L003_ARTSF|nr:hypothetical protein QYM36_012473 [Artemia franciscana]